MYRLFGNYSIKVFDWLRYKKEVLCLLVFEFYVIDVDYMVVELVECKNEC